MNDKIKILAIFNQLSETTIPVENFLLLKNSEFDKNILVFYGKDEHNNRIIKSKNSSYEGTLKSLEFDIKNLLKFDFYTILIEYINKLNPDIIHLHHTISSFLVLFFKKRLNKNIRIVLTMHNDYDFYKKTQKFMFWFAIKHTDYIIANSQNTLNKIVHLNVKDKSTVIYNGVNFEDICNPKSAPVEPLKVGTVGRIIPQKDHKTLINAFKIVLNKLDRSNITLEIIGDGALKQDLQEQIRKNNLQDYVKLLGFMDRSDVYKKLEEFDIFIVSSIFEGFCNAMVEAMASRCAVIASNIDPLPEVIGEGNGLLFEVGDEKDLAEKIIQLLNNKEKIANLGKLSRKYAFDNYSLKKCTSMHTDFYKKILDDN